MSARARFRPWFAPAFEEQIAQFWTQYHARRDEEQFALDFMGATEHDDPELVVALFRDLRAQAQSNGLPLCAPRAFEQRRIGLSNMAAPFRQR